MILGKDDFNRGPAGSLGADWTEQGGGILSVSSDFDITAGGEATLGTGTGFRLATMNSTSHTKCGVQAYINRGVISTSVTCGLCWRFQDGNNFYYCAIYDTGGADALLLVRVIAGASTVLANIIMDGVGGRPFSTNLVRLCVTMDDDDRISVFHESAYFTGFTTAGAATREGEIWQGVDASPIVGSGLAGICSSSSLSGSAGAMLWDNFLATNYEPETIYVDLNASGPSFGTAASPDVGIRQALNSVLAIRGSEMVFDEGQPTIGNGNAPVGFSEGDFQIGHAYKFKAAGSESFPSYSPEDGAVVDAGSPVLAIRGGTSQKTPLRETRNTGFFTIRGFASWILFEGLAFDATGGSLSKLYQTLSANNIGASTEHSVAVDKSDLEISTTGAGLCRSAHSADMTALRYCDIDAPAGISALEALVLGSSSGARMVDADVSFCTFRGIFQRVVQQTGTIPLGGLCDLAHLHVVDCASNSLTCSALEVTDASHVSGTLQLRDSIVASELADPTDFGVRVVAGAPAGTLQAYSNGYQNVTTPRDTGVMDGGSELEGVDPVFRDRSSPYLWPQTSSSPPITLPEDLRPTAADYLQSASDSYEGVVLDRGALQVLVFPSGAPIRLQRSPTLCGRLIYDPSGLNLDLSDRFLLGRPIRQEKEVLLRKYKINDTHFEIADPEGLFVEGSPNSVMESGGFPDWLGKEVLLQVYESDGSTLLFEYRGFVIGVTSAAGKSQLQVGNRFQQIFRKHPFANSAGRIQSSTGETAVAGKSAPASGSYLADVTPSLANGCEVETWTFRYLNATQFEAIGSKTGRDGIGDRTAAFTSDSGKISVASADWIEDGGDPFTSGTEVTIKTVYRYLANITVDAFLETLQGEYLADLDPEDVDDDIELVYRGSEIDQALDVDLVIDDEGDTVLDVLQDIANHMLAIAIERTDGRVSLYGYFPQFGEQTLTETLCKFSDLMSATLDRSPLYNLFRYQFGWNEATESFEDGLEVPADRSQNDSADRYDRLIPAPSAFELKGFTDASIDWIRSMGEQQYVRFGQPRPRPQTQAKVERLGIELIDFFRVDSSHPEFALACEVIAVERSIFPRPSVRIRLSDASFYRQFAGDCGYAFTDVGHQHDNCFLYF